MSNVRASTVLVVAALVAFGVALLLRDRNDSLSSALFFAVTPVCAIAGFVASAVILWRDRRPLRWAELVVSAGLITFLAQVR